jgi:hypothetical protein
MNGTESRTTIMSITSFRAIAIIVVLMGSAASQVRAQQKPATTETPAPDVLPVTLTAQVNLTKLSPLAKTGSLKCYARVGPRNILDNVARNINAPGAHDTTWFDTGLASFGHYSGAETTVPFTIENGGYTGSQTVKLSVSAAGQKDQQTGKLYTDPVVIAGCIVYINDMKVPVSADPQLPNGGNVATLTGPAWFAIEQDVKYK